METNDPGSVRIEPATPARASVIWLHGLGADGHDFEPIVPQFGLAADLPARFVFPHAPVRPVTLNGGMPMRAWFDIDRLDFEARSWDESGVAASVARVEALVTAEIAAGIERSRIVIAGFSQGGTIALEYLIRHGTGLAGIMALSTFHPAGINGVAAPDGSRPEIFAAHGTADPVVAYALGERSLAAFARAGYTVRWHRYPMVHQVCPPEIAAIGAWLQTVLSE
ncbi:MAG: alpha/beta hydrolase [Gammaproteobacteria bacterium]